MAPSWWQGLRASSRFGAAVRLQKAGRLEEARAALLDLNAWFEQADRVPPRLQSVRLMTLVHLSATSQKLGDDAVAQDALRKWLDAYERACSEEPSFRSVQVLKEWERWVRARLPPQS